MGRRGKGDDGQDQRKDGDDGPPSDQLQGGRGDRMFPPLYEQKGKRRKEMEEE